MSDIVELFLNYKIDEDYVYMYLISPYIERDTYKKFINALGKYKIVIDDAKKMKECIKDYLIDFMQCINEPDINHTRSFILYLLKECKVKFPLRKILNEFYVNIDKIEELGYDLHKFIQLQFDVFNTKEPFFDSDGEGIDPREFYLLKDKKEDVQISSVSPYKFSEIRTSPLIVMDDEVLTVDTINPRAVEIAKENNEVIHHQDLMDDYDHRHDIEKTNTIAYLNGYDQYEDVKNIAVGSAFGLVALLEHIEGNIEKVKKTLIDYGFKKIYINNTLAWTDRAYLRIASLSRLSALSKSVYSNNFVHKRLMEKI